MGRIRLGHIKVNERTKDLVALALEQDKLGQTDFITRFEQEFAKWAGTKFAVAVASGTVADTVALAVLKYLNPAKTEVIVPALTFVAQTNSIIYNGLSPVFVDVSSALLMRPEDAAQKINSKTLCVFPVHLLGRPCDMTGYKQMTGAYKVPMIEDTCEAMGSQFDGNMCGWRKCGTFGEMGTFSFFPSHTITTGEGGMITTDNEELATLCRKFVNHGKTSSLEFHFDAVGFNGKMSSLQAAVGLGTLPEADSIIAARRENFFALGGREENRYELVSPHGAPFMASSRAHRDACLEILRQNGIECRNLFSSLPTQETVYKHLGHRLGDFPVAERIGDVGFYVPVHQGLSEEQLEQMKQIIATLVPQ
jgi:dTDP-4-amino-4,6-dideoxygalactose transaminase